MTKEREKKEKSKTKVGRADGRSQIKGVCAWGSGCLRRAQLGTMAHTGTARSSGALLCALLLLSSLAGAQLLDAASEEELSPRALRDFYPKGPNLTSEKQLVRSAVAPPERSLDVRIQLRETHFYSIVVNIFQYFYFIVVNVSVCF